MQVSVLMPVYNAEKYISKAIESVLEQSYKNFEFIIINDGSTDNSYSIIEKYAKKDIRIKLFSQSNMGIVYTLNRGLKIAKNDWIIRMDADDIMLPNRIERQVEFVIKNPAIAVASCLVYYINEDDEIIGKNTSELKTKEDLDWYIKHHEPIGFHHPGVIMKKNIVIKVGGYRAEYWPAEDIDLWTRIAEKGYLTLVQQEYLIKYRIHSSSISVNNVRKVRFIMKYLKTNILRRRNGKAEISIKEFEDIEKSKSFLYKLNNYRKDLAKVYYKKGIYYYSSGLFLKAFFILILSLLFQPNYIINQLMIKKIIMGEKIEANNK